MNDKNLSKNNFLVEPIKLVQYLILIIGFFIISPYIFYSTWKSSGDFHSSIEMSSAIIAIIAGITGIIYFLNIGNTFFLIVGLGFFIVGMEDFLHGFLGFKKIWGNSGLDFTSFITDNYVTGEFLLGIFVILAILTEKIIKDKKKIKEKARIFIPISLLSGILITTIAFYLPLPKMIYENQLISRPINLISAIIFLLAFILGYRRLLRTRDSFTHFLLLSILLNVIAQLYMSFSKQVFDIFFDISHIANLLSYIMPVLGISVYLNEQHKKIAFSQRKLNEKMEEVNKINQKLENYSYTISHDLKEPIRSIRTFSEFIMEDYESTFDEEAKDYFSRIVKASTKMASMIDDLLILSRIGRTDINFEKISISNIVDEVKETLRQKSKETNTIIKTNNLPELICQPVWIQAVFLNLIDNSIKYSDKEETIIEVIYQDKDKYHEFSIKDNGKGIPKEQHKKIFGLFRKAHQDRNIEGSGAGLAIVSSVIEQHRGCIWVDWSEEKKGSNIKFIIAKNIESLKEVAYDN